jgi:hypothetical protein
MVRVQHHLGESNTYTYNRIWLCYGGIYVVCRVHDVVTLMHSITFIFSISNMITIFPGGYNAASI